VNAMAPSRNTSPGPGAPPARKGSMLRTVRVDSVTDALTGLGNRRRLMADLDDELAVATAER